MVGTMWDSMVNGPVIQVTVPEAKRAASLSMTGPRAATRTGGGGASMVSAPKVAAFKVSPVYATCSPAKQRHEDREVLPHVASRLLERLAEDVLDHHLVREADPQGQSSAGCGLHGQCLAGKHHRMARIGGNHRRPQLDIRYLSAHHSQERQRVVPKDLRRPRRLDAGRTQPVDLRYHVVKRTLDIEHHTDLHRFLPRWPTVRPGRPTHTVLGSIMGVASRMWSRNMSTTAPIGQTTGMSVAIVMGSSSDASIMDDAVQILRSFGIDVEVRVISAHRTPDDAIEFARSASGRGVQVIIAAAGGAAHLAGVLAAATPVPVIGVPIALANLGGLDSLLAMVQMPKGVPVATVAVNGARNAGLLAVRILSLSDERLAAEQDRFRRELADQVRDMDAEVQARYTS